MSCDAGAEVWAVLAEVYVSFCPVLIADKAVSRLNDLPSADAIRIRAAHALFSCRDLCAGSSNAFRDEEASFSAAEVWASFIEIDAAFSPFFVAKETIACGDDCASAHAIRIF